VTHWHSENFGDSNIDGIMRKWAVVNQRKPNVHNTLVDNTGMTTVAIKLLASKHTVHILVSCSAYVNEASIVAAR
jgi:hypothetical protein